MSEAYLKQVVDSSKYQKLSSKNVEINFKKTLGEQDLADDEY